MITDSVIPDGQVTPPGMPFGHVEQSGLVPSAKLTSWINSLIATVPPPSQSPTHCAGTGVFVGFAPHFPTQVPVGIGVVDPCGVGVGMRQIRPLQVGVGE